MLALRQIIMQQHPNITHELKYGMPFFCYNKKMFCYLWFHKKHQLPYIGLVEGDLFNETFLLKEKRLRMKIMLLNPNEDLPLQKIERILQKALSYYEGKV